MTALLTLAQSLGIDPGPLNQADLQEQTCSRALVEIQHLWNQLDKDWKYGCTPEDAKKLRERNELAAQVEQLKHEREEALTLVVRYQSLLECAIRGEEIIVGDAIIIGIDAELADEIEDSFDESPKAALAALKAQCQADAIDCCEKEVTASVNVLLKPHIAGVFAVIRQRAQGAGYE